MVDLKYRFFHGEILYSIFQLLIKNLAAVVKVLIVYPDRQDKVHKFPYRDTLSPRHLGTRLKGILHVFQVELGAVIGNIGEWHVGIQELHCLQFATSQGTEYIKITVTGHHLTSRFEVLGNFACAVKILFCCQLSE